MCSIPRPPLCRTLLDFVTVFAPPFICTLLLHRNYDSYLRYAKAKSKSSPAVQKPAPKSNCFPSLGKSIQHPIPRILSYFLSYSTAFQLYSIRCQLIQTNNWLLIQETPISIKYKPPFKRNQKIRQNQFRECFSICPLHAGKHKSKFTNVLSIEGWCSVCLYPYLTHGPPFQIEEKNRP